MMRISGRERAYCTVSIVTAIGVRLGLLPAANYAALVAAGLLSVVLFPVLALGRIELAYHHGEIAQALDGLTPREREYVFLRFWCGWKLPQMREHFGYEPSALWRKARPKLTLALAHLA